MVLYKVYAIVVTYNGSKWINKCFGSLLNSTIPLKVLAIDNLSTDGTPDLIRSKFPSVQVIEAGQNLGFGKANNIGLKIALEEHADYVFLLNQDAWIEPETIEKLFNVQKEHPEYNLLSPIHLNANGTAIDLFFQNYLSNAFTPGFYSDLFLNQTKIIYETKFVNAAGWFITQKCLKEIGGFDPIFQHYGEDEDYILRMQKKSLKVGVVISSILYHDRVQDGQRNNMYEKNEVFKQAILTIRKQKHKPSRFFLFRRVVYNYFGLYFVYLGRNNRLKALITMDIIFLKYYKNNLFNSQKVLLNNN